MDTFDNVESFSEEDVQLFDSLLDDEMCTELYNGQFDGSHDWLDSLMKDEDKYLVEDCMLMSGISSSLNMQPPLVCCEHSYSLAADSSHSTPVVKTELNEYVDYDLDVLNAVNPNLAMTHCSLETDYDDSAEELDQTDDVKPEIYMWDENDIEESEPEVPSDDARSTQSEHISAVSTPLPTAIVVTGSTKLVHQQPTIIVTHARRPTTCNSSPVVARMSKAGILSRIRPTTVTIDGSSGLILKNNTVVVSSQENCFC